MSDTKQKVSVWVEIDHLSRAKGAGYTSPTTAINKGLALLMESITENEQRTYDGHAVNNIGRMGDNTADSVVRTEDITADNVGRMEGYTSCKIERVENTVTGNVGHIEDTTLDNVGQMRDHTVDNVGRMGDNIENAMIRARLEEIEKSNEILKKELEISQEMHRNYMMQIQTLINQKAIEAPGAKKPWWRFW